MRRILNKKFPTVIGLLLLLLTIGGVFYFFYQKKTLPIFKKEPVVNVQPVEILVTNVEAEQFSVSWLTKDPGIGFLKYGLTPSLNSLAFDDRDVLTGDKQLGKTHLVTVKNLQPEKVYYFKIGSDTVYREESSLYDNNGQPFTVTTGRVLGRTEEKRIVNGRILKTAKNPASDTLVYFSSANISPLTTMTDKNGRWTIFLNKARSIDLGSWAQFDIESTIFQIESTDGEQKTLATILIKDLFPAVPDLLLGHAAYDFRKGVTGEQLTTVPVSTASASQQTLTIDNPAVEGEKLNTLKPEFIGQGPAGKVVTIKIESDTPYTTTVVVDSEGQWRLSPQTALSPGEHKITVSYLGDDGEIQTATKNFVILAAGTSEIPAITATPSASMVPSPSPTPSPVVSPSPEPSIVPSPSPSPSPILVIPTPEPIPITGNLLPTLAIGAAGIILFVSGLVLII